MSLRLLVLQFRHRHHFYPVIKVAILTHTPIANNTQLSLQDYRCRLFVLSLLLFQWNPRNKETNTLNISINSIKLFLSHGSTNGSLGSGKSLLTLFSLQSGISLVSIPTIQTGCSLFTIATSCSVYSIASCSTRWTRGTSLTSRSLCACVISHHTYIPVTYTYP